jgi:hypothetical protein
MSRRLLPMAASIALMACGGGVTTPSTPLVAGVYSLSSINGAALPFLLQFVDDSNLVEFQGGAVTINTDGSFVDSASIHITQTGADSTENDVATGSWKQNGNTITFTPTQGDPYAMSWNGETQLTQSFAGLILAYIH